jgi:hypothetical protein
LVKKVAKPQKTFLSFTFGVKNGKTPLGLNFPETLEVLFGKPYGENLSTKL